MIDEIVKLADAGAKIVGVLAWPLVALLCIIRFGSVLRDFLSNITEGSVKVLGVEASGKRRAEAAALIATAESARSEIDLQDKSTPNQSTSEKSNAVSKSISKSVNTYSKIIDSVSLENARDRIVLWVDDEPDNNIYERNALRALGFRIWNSKSSADAIKFITEIGSADIVISDMKRPEGDLAGYDLLRQLRAMGIQVPFIIYSGSNTVEQRRQAKKEGAFGSTANAGQLIEMIFDALKT